MEEESKYTPLSQDELKADVIRMAKEKNDKQLREALNAMSQEELVLRALAIAELLKENT